MPENNTGTPSLVALRLAEEKACAGYLAARQAMVTLASRVESVSQMVRERPGRADYRQVLADLVHKQGAARARTRLAYNLWQRAQLRTDALWSQSPKNGGNTAVVARAARTEAA